MSDYDYLQQKRNMIVGAFVIVGKKDHKMAVQYESMLRYQVYHIQDHRL